MLTMKNNEIQRKTKINPTRRGLKGKEKLGETAWTECLDGDVVVSCTDRWRTYQQH